MTTRTTKKTTNPTLTAKELATILNVTICTAKKYISDMKDYYKPKSNKVTYMHYVDYFAVPKEKKV
ncbi:hypothetical protein [Thalassobellus citreus]|uniref:hypothetical protein n=1 Tax=Thalassobellus citreus TaxID=3367752 RepID=UPI0037AB6D71